MKQHYGSPALRGTIETFLIFILPMLPIIYGVITRDKVGAILMGVMPFFGMFSVILFMEAIEVSGISIATISG